MPVDLLPCCLVEAPKLIVVNKSDVEAFKQILIQWGHRLLFCSSRFLHHTINELLY